MGQNGATLATRWGNIVDAECADCAAFSYLVTYDTGSHPYTIVHGTIGGDGNPDNDLISVGWFGAGSWQGSSVTRADMAAGTLNDLTIDHKTLSLPEGVVVGVQLDLYDSGDTIKETTGARTGYSVTWATWAAFTALGWSMADGDYVLVYVGITTVNEADADATDIRADNILLAGELA